VALLNSGVLHHISDFLVLKKEKNMRHDQNKKNSIYLISSRVDNAKKLAQQRVTTGGGDYNFYNLGQNL